ncbi:MAG: translocation/assembly module TamB domain-containing protein [Paludibacter sp.]|nr:translocation/assembly module TamB domain-containing protein [Paludibacter sp.]
MKSLLKKTLKAILWVVGIFVLLFIILAVLIQFPAIQTKIVHFATSIVSDKTHTRVEIQNVSIAFPKTVVLKGLFLEDLKNDTLVYAGKAKVNIALYDLLFSKIDIHSFALENVTLNLKRGLNDSLYNFNFLLTAFADTTKKVTPVTKTPSKWKFSVDKVSLTDIRLHFDDKYGGIDARADFKELKLNMDEIDLEKSSYKMDELKIDGLLADVRMKESKSPKAKKSTSKLPLLAANKIRINNSTVRYNDLPGHQSVFGTIDEFELKDGTVDLEKELVSLDQVSLSKSKIQYNSLQTTLSTVKTGKGNVSVNNNWKVNVKTVEMKDNSVSYQVTNMPVLTNSFDPNHLYFKYFSLSAKDIAYSSARTEAKIIKFNAIDKNNFIITRFETDFNMDQHSITANKLKVKTSNSTLDADVNLRFKSLKSLKESIPTLFINVEMKDVRVRNSDILYFNPALIKQPFFKNRMNITSLTGVLKGQVNNLKGKNIVLKTGSKTLLKTDFTITGLPKAETAYFDFPNLIATSGKSDINMMAGPYIPNSMELPEDVNIQAVFKGRMKSFETIVGLKSSFGGADLKASIDQNENFNSNMTVSDFDMGRLLKDKAMYGPVSLTASANGHGLDKNTITASLKAEVSQVYLNKYTYHNLNVDGKVNGRMFEGKVNLNDKNAVFDFDGLVNLNPNKESYKFNLRVQGIDLQKLNWTKDDLRISLVAAADLKGGTVTKMNGRAGISKIILAHGTKKYMLDSLLVASINEPKRSEINIRSSLINIKYTGAVSPAALPASLSEFLNNYFVFSDTKPSKWKNNLSDFNFQIQLHNHPIFSEVFFPELKEFVPGLIQGSYDSLKNNLKLTASIPKMVYGSTEMNDLLLDIHSDSTTLNYKVSSTSITNSQIELDNFMFDGKISGNKILANISSIDDSNTKKLVIQSQITRDKSNYILTLDPKEFYLMNKNWDIAADNSIKFGKQGFLIHHLFMSNGENQINIASVHDKFNDDLNIAIKNFDLNDISQIVEKDTSLVAGRVDGNVLLKRVNNSYGIIADARISNLAVHNVPIGNLSLKADNPTSQKFDIDMKLSGVDNNMTAGGTYIPNGGNNSINIKADIQSLSMKTIEAFSMGQISEASGKMTGNFLVSGNTSTPDITGELVFENAFMKPATLNNRLELKHETIQLKKEGLFFNSFTMLDAGQHRAVINGSIKMKQFSDYIFALQVNTKDFLLFNTTSKENKVFFGRMIIDSNIDIKGPMSLPIVNAKLKMKKGSNFTFAVPEDKLTTDRGEDVVEFNDSLKFNPILNRKEIKTINKTGFSGFDLSSIIEVDKEATLRLLMDPASSDSLVVKGEAALSFTMDRSGKMSLTGAYNLNDGSYLVSLQSVIKKKFVIVPGSTIIWNGDPMDADININAIYTQRAAPIDLVSDQMSGLSATETGGYKQPYPFLVLLKLRGAILRPEISFEIQLRPEDKGILNGTVNQKLILLNADPSALNKQVFALLVLGRFVQENPLQTEGGGTSTLLRSTVGNFLSAELNKLSSKVLPGVELNFDIQSYDDFQSGQAQGRTQVGIGLKKQLFDERLSVQVGGNVDVEGSKAQKNQAGDIASDIAVEYKLTKDGRYRVKAFRHNLYEGAIDGQLVETGAGVVYVRDFNIWKDFFLSPDKKKEETPVTPKTK